jgi:radical SAM protein with 4Fe4S-binding SPASM domain
MDWVLGTFEAGAPYVAGPFDDLLRELVCPEARAYPCGAGRGYVAIAPTGGIFPCHRFMGNQEYLMGSIYTGIDRAVAALFWGNTPMAKPDCSRCWVRNLCAGGCAHEQMKETGRIDLTSEDGCNAMRSLVEMAVYMAFELQKRFPAQFQRFLQSGAAAPLTERVR